MTSQEIRGKFLEFFEKKGHKIVPSSSLVPEGDLSVLLTTAGMQQFKPYFTGDKDPMKDFGSRRTASVQKSFRTSDIDEVGDESHLTFFEMLGHFSFGDYFKKETIEWTFELLTKIFGIDKERISASVFKGDQKIPKDQESYDAWLRFLPAEKIKLGLREDGNIWGPAGPEGPCGACNEVYVDGLEVATLVFMEYFYSKDDVFAPLKQKGVDVGWGFERLVKVIQSAPTVFETDLFLPIIEMIPHQDIVGNLNKEARSVRIIADHIRGATFLIADGILPSNIAQGYILRRLLRRAIRYGRILNLDKNFLVSLSQKVIEICKEFYPELRVKRDDILTVIQKEEEKFSKTLKNGLKELEKMLAAKADKIISGNDAFYLYESYGFPMELTRELAKEKGFLIDESGWETALKKHQEISRAGAEKKFGGHGLEKVPSSKFQVPSSDVEKITRLHTATHLLHQALHDVLGGIAEIKQMGSDITEERTRFDFTFPRKLIPEEIKKIENIVNDKIKLDLPVYAQKMPKEKALKLEAKAFFKEKYPDEVNVYSVGDPDLSKAYSKEFCGGPHVKSTGEIGSFKIIKEESSSAGIRRIRAIVE
ncbi:MAG: Alanine-tRNA ligase [Candidatus Azambacteria bacterium GW2011_GWA2_39_10]|uniref:Alanine--tRNA ligase n=1 Tax=Candidatus Azambacteria bacterium GW2011_GWA2_39_10 TaxID=1618611 RepID=A0A0G0LHJ0_9BACT|nr:MAG: Alanine-tRNA ligase [Candidatus Azambacteria bacterium GW2011_GWA2_39_10]